MGLIEIVVRIGVKICTHLYHPIKKKKKKKMHSNKGSPRRVPFRKLRIGIGLLPAFLSGFLQV